MSCVLCEAPDRTGDIVFEDSSSLVIAHSDWATRGHLMVVWKAHVENLSDLSDDEAAHFLHVHRSAEREVLLATSQDRAILFKLGVATPHLHVHIYPVSARLDRGGVMAIIEARVTDSADEQTRQELIEDLRTRLRAN